MFTQEVENNQHMMREIIKKDMKEKLLYNWLFHYNRYTEKWHAFPREEYVNYFNGVSENAVSAETHEACVLLAVEKEMNLRKR